MKYVLVTALLAAASGGATGAVAATVPSSHLFVAVNCASHDTVAASYQYGTSASDSCSTADASARTRASYTSLGSQTEGDAYAGGHFEDAISLGTADTSLLGQQARVVFSIAFDGSLLNETVVRFQAFQIDGYSYTGGDIAWSADVTTGTGTSAEGGHRSMAVFLNGSDGESKSYDGVFNITFQGTFGSFLNYRFDLDAFGFNANSAINFYNTAALSSISAFDQQGNLVSISGQSSSGTDLSSYIAQAPAVPLPAAGWLLAGALGAIGAARKRRKA